MSSELTVRFVTRQDYAQWLPLWDGYNAFYGRSGATALAPEITAMTWARFFDAYEPVHALVAESGGQLLGLTHYLFHRSTTAIEPVCYLQDLFTNEAARGKGVGRALINGVYRTGEACRIAAGLLADPPDQPHRDAALRQGRGALRICRVSQAVLTGLACLLRLEYRHARAVPAIHASLRAAAKDVDARGQARA